MIGQSVNVAGQKPGAVTGGKARMMKQKLKVGDKIRVIGYRPGKYATGAVDDLGTEDLFKSMVGRCYKIRGFDKYGHIELRPKPLDTVWIESDLIELVRKKNKSSRPNARRRSGIL